MKKFIAAMVAAFLIVLSSFNVFAAWVPDAGGLRWQNDDGTFTTYGWQWIDDNGDGVSERYCFDPYGYVMVNTTTPDGCTVNQYGAWYKDGEVRVHYDETGVAPASTNVYYPATPQVSGWQSGPPQVNNNQQVPPPPQ